jgi:hypothetical protein
LLNLFVKGFALSISHCRNKECQKYSECSGHVLWQPTFISFAMGWISVVRQPIQKPINIVDDENKN